MNFFRPQNHPQNDPRTLPEALWTPKWPCNPPWGLPGRLFGPQSRPKSIPKVPQRQPKTHQSGPMAPKWSLPVPTSLPKAAPSAPQGTPKHQFSAKPFNCPLKSQRSTQNHRFSAIRRSSSLAAAFLPFGLCFCIAFVKTTIPVHVP